MSGQAWPVRVFYEDTDAGGVVYHTNYIKYFERGRTEWLRALGYSQARLAEEQRLLFTVVNLSIEYRRPARLDDLLEVRTTAELAGAASVNFKQEIWRGGTTPELLAAGEVRVACIDADGFKPRRLPDAMRKDFT